MEALQKDINPSMRSILVDWLVEVHAGSSTLIYSFSFSSIFNWFSRAGFRRI